jgi:hypothetical protein
LQPVAKKKEAMQTDAVPSYLRTTTIEELRRMPGKAQAGLLIRRLSADPSLPSPNPRRGSFMKNDMDRGL